MAPVVVIPVYNEAAALDAVVRGARRHASDIVVDDGSSDGSGDLAARAGAEVIRHRQRQGKAAALRSGIARARRRGATAVVTLDGDGQHAPEDLALVLEHQAGLNVYAAGSAPERLPPVYSLEPTPTELRIAQPNGAYRTLTAPPAPRPEQRLATNTGRRSLRLLGPGGEGLAELPQDRVTLHGGSGGLFLSAAFPSGLGGDDRTPMTLYMAEHNRYLARVEAAR